MRFTLFYLLLPVFVLLSACGNEVKKPKVTCVKIKDFPEFETLAWEKVGDIQALVDQRFEKEIMGKQFGEQNYCTLSLTLKNKSCFTAKFTVHFSLTTFSKKEETDDKIKELKPGEEIEFKSTPFEVKDASDISDKSFEVKPEFIRKKSKITYEKECLEADTKCKCDAQNDDTDASKILTVIKDEPLKCESEVKAVVQGQIGSNAGEEPKQVAKKEKKKQ